MPTPDYDPSVPIVAGGGEHVDERIVNSGIDRRLTAVAVPNSHLVTIVDRYDESELVTAGRVVAHRTDVFPIGANLSFVLPLGGIEVFVRTFERGAGLTPSCGSGVVASRLVYSRLGLAPASEPVLVRNPGGPSTVRIREVGGVGRPTLEGNATYVYSAAVDLDKLLSGDVEFTSRRVFDDDIVAFEELNRKNLDAIARAGVKASFG
jgi:diaminopimelate epimerase